MKAFAPPAIQRAVQSRALHLGQISIIKPFHDIWVSLLPACSPSKNIRILWLVSQAIEKNVYVGGIWTNSYEALKQLAKDLMSKSIERDISAHFLPSLKTIVQQEIGDNEHIAVESSGHKERDSETEELQPVHVWSFLFAKP